ncbi:hypothetical protein BT96DRAFT_767526, partial [Gymnopus androsaceus JB14]
MIHDSGLSKSLWGEAVTHAIWLKNRTPTRVLGGKTPFELVYGRKPDLGKLPVWGTKVYVHSRKGGKLGT